jgi:phosphatidylglycerophosphate synthase
MNIDWINPIWITLGPIVVINVVLFISYLTYQLWGRKRLAREYKGAKNVGSKMLSSNTREWWFWTTEPIVRLFVRLRMGPNTITVMGFLITCSAAYFFARGWFGYAGWAMIFGASFDMFDGRVARLTGKESRSGAFFDAVMDRFSEGATLLGLAYFFRDSFMLPVVIAALIGSMLVSYTRAMGMGGGVDCKVGMMQRPERIVYLGVAAAMDPLAGVALSRWWANPAPVLVILAVGFIALMTLITAVHRMIYIMNSLDTEDRREKETIPQLITKLSTQEGREKVWEKARYGYDRNKGAFSNAVLFVASGLSTGTVRDALKGGDMPNVARHIVERGGIGEVTSTFPSTFGPASMPFVTGCFPGTCDIPASRWFDRTVHPGRVLTMNRFRDYAGWGAYAMDHDLSKSVRTIYEYSRRAMNIFGALNRGCGLIRDPSFFRTHKFFAEARSAAEMDKASEAAFYWFSSAVKRETDFVFYRFQPMLAMGDGKGGHDALKACRKVDGDIGRAVELLKSQGMYDRTALMLTCDYSCGGVRTTFDLEDFISTRFRRVATSARRMKDWQDAEAIALTSGTSMAHLYIRNEGSWSRHNFFEDIEKRGLVGSLLEQDGVDVLAGRSVEGGIVVQSRRGRAHLIQDADGRITYMSGSGDPFGLENVPQVMDDGQCLRITRGSDYPDGIVQMLQIFRSGRTGDLVMSASDGVVFAADAETVGGVTHGSLRSEHIVVPFALSIPGRVDAMRTSDVFALTLALLGIDPAHSLDGTIPSGVEFQGIEAAATK